MEIEYVINPSKEGVPTKSTLLRCRRDVCIIAAADEFPLGSNLYFEQMRGELLPSKWYSEKKTRNNKVEII